MNKKIQLLLVCGPALFGFIVAITAPVVSLHFIKLIDPSVYALNTVVYTAIAAVVQSLSSKESVRKVLKKIFLIIMLFDSTAYTIVSMLGDNNASIRYILINVLSASSVSMCQVVMTDAINGVLNGSKLTSFETLGNAVHLWASLAGGIISIMLVGKLSVDVAIYMQCGANVVSATMDYTAFKGMRKEV